MKKTCTILLTLLMSFCGQDIFAQFVVAQDTIRGEIDFCPRLGDFTNAIKVPNDSVFYMFPPDLTINPWRYVRYYTPSREIQTGYIRGTQLMRIDDYDIVEVERLSSHGSIFFKNDAVRVAISTSPVTAKDTYIRQSSNGSYTVNGRQAKGISREIAPKIKYNSITVSIDSRTFTVPKSMYEHLLNPNIENTVVYYNADKKIVYIKANNGSVNTSYTALWVINPKGVKNVYVFDPETE